MDHKQIERELENILMQSDNACSEAYKAKAEKEIAHKRLKAILPVIATEMEGSETAKERLAQADERYQKAMKMYVDAEYDFADKWSKYESLKLKLSACQTLNKIAHFEANVQNHA